MNEEDSKPIGRGTTTLDYLCNAHPWLKGVMDKLRSERDEALAELGESREALERYGAVLDAVVAKCEVGIEAKESLQESGIKEFVEHHLKLERGHK